jgi:hypothetical protein
LITLYLDGFTHLLNSLGIATGLAGAEEGCNYGAHNCGGTRNPKDIWSDELPDNGNQRSPLWRSSILAQII